MSAHEKASPRPWAIDPAGSGDIIQPLYANGEYSGGIILYRKPSGRGWFIDEATAEANAALIVKAVNAHDDLVALAGSYGPEVSMLNEEIEGLTAERDALKAENERLQDEQSTVDHWSLGYRAGWEDCKAGKPQTNTLPSINSAPKTGECVLGICMEAQTPGWRLTWWDGGWVVVGKPEKFSSIPARWWPTHWLPLPDVPPPSLR